MSESRTIGRREQGRIGAVLRAAAEKLLEAPYETDAAELLAIAQLIDPKTECDPVTELGKLLQQARETIVAQKAQIDAIAPAPSIAGDLDDKGQADLLAAELALLATPAAPTEAVKVN